MLHKKSDVKCKKSIWWTMCRVLSTQASVPLVYVPVEAIASKWYGESEHLLRDIFKAAEQLEGCLIFLDEIDSLATSRG